MERLRLFLAIDIYESQIEKIKIVQKKLEELFPEIKWTKPETWHLTIKFFGETNKDKLNNIIEICKTVFRKYSNFDITLKDISAFPNLRMPRVIFIDTQIPEILHQIHEELEKKFEDLGFKREDRKFHPHLTLARIKDVKVFLKHNQQKIENIKEIGKEIYYNLKVNEIVLYQSILSKEGPKYLKLAKFKLSD
ncbi:MAG: RNA 2',3'-cyclic phosphodiesterase [Proteobacteria bacterium]|nr:RNA 2',3'-cyclic phosphodiesterase [Pseudomonadota bacterium]